MRLGNRVQRGGSFSITVAGGFNFSMHLKRLRLRVCSSNFFEFFDYACFFSSLGQIAVIAFSSSNYLVLYFPKMAFLHNV